MFHRAKKTFQFDPRLSAAGTASTDIQLATTFLGKIKALLEATMARQDSEILLDMSDDRQLKA